MRRFVTFLAAWLFAYLARGDAADLATTKFQYDAGITAIHSARLEAERTLSSQYTNTLHTLRIRAQNAGDLDTVKQLLAEKARFDGERCAPAAPPALPDLRKLAEALRKRLREIEVTEATDTIRQAQQYDVTLSALQTSLTRQGKIDEASTVQDERKALAASETYLQAKATLAQSSSPAKPQTLAPPALSIAELLTSPDYEWTPPENLGPGVNSRSDERTVTLSGDGLTLIFMSVSNANITNEDLYESRRTSVSDPFGSPISLKDLNTPRYESAASLSDDGLTLIYHADNGPNHHGSGDMYVSKRPSRTSAWTRPENLGKSINSTNWEGTPGLSHDGLTLMYGSTQGSKSGESHLWRSRRATPQGQWETAERVTTDAPASKYEGHPDFAPDDQAIVFLRDKVLFIASVVTNGPLTSIPLDLRVSGKVDSPCLSRDGCTLYFTSDCPGGYGGWDVWKTRRIPRVRAMPAAATNRISWIVPQVPLPNSTGWITVFDGQRLSGCNPDAEAIAAGKIGVEDGILRLDRANIAFAVTGRDVAVRARLKKVSGQNVAFGRHAGSGAGYLGWFEGGRSFGIGKVTTRYVTIQRGSPAEVCDDFFDMEFAIEGSTMTIKANGSTVVTATDGDVVEAGTLSIGTLKGIALFKRIEVRVLDGRK